MDEQGRGRVGWLIAGAVVVVLLGLRMLGGGAGSEGGASVSVDGAATAPKASATAARGSRPRLWVHVAGAVRRPGLYRVRADARVGAAVDRAGGLTRRADLTRINLAATLRDGQQVIVPVRGAAPVAAPGAGESGAGGAGGTPGPGGAGGSKVSLATATVDQLDVLDGIGPTLAQRIVQWRDAHGGFRSVDQLREVEGIGEKRLEALKAALMP